MFKKIGEILFDILYILSGNTGNLIRAFINMLLITLIVVGIVKGEEIINLVFLYFLYNIADDTANIYKKLK